MSSWLDGLAEEDTRLFVWGLFTRGIGLTYVISHAAFIPQDMPLLTRLWYFPTLFWACAEDWFLPLVPTAGMVCGFLAFLGGSWSPLYLALAWALSLSMDQAIEHVYPWDMLLLESGFLCLWLPATNFLFGDGVLAALSSSLSSLSLATMASPAWWSSLTSSALASLSTTSAWATTALPFPILAFTLRWLVVRVLVGFGRVKFVGATPKDRLYIKSFYLGQPMVTKEGFFAYNLPNWFHTLSLFLMFVIELLAPWGLFFLGWPRVVAAGAILFLMIGIQLVGNYGYFNLLTVVLCIPALDVVTSVWDTRVPLLGATPLAAFPASELSLWFFLAIILPGTIFYLLLNSWCTLGGLYWPNLAKSAPTWLFQSVFKFYRFVQPWRIVHAYGVFPPHSAPAMKWAPVFEGSSDGVTWKPYKYKHLISGPRTAPHHVAPWHPRIDHAIFYDSIGVNGHNFISNVGNNNPYRFSRSTPWMRLQARLLEGANSPVYRLFHETPFPDPAHPPKWVRVSMYGFHPAPLRHILKTGEWFLPVRTATHLPPLCLGPKVDTIWDQWLPEPERYYWEARIWRERAGRSAGTLEAEEYETMWRFLAFLRAAATEAADLVARNVAAGPTTILRVTPALERRVTPIADAMDAHEARRVFHWTTLPHVILAVRQVYSPAELLRIERTLGRALLPAIARLIRLFHRPTPSRADLEAELREDATVRDREGLSNDDRAALSEWAAWAAGDRASANPESGAPWGSKPAHTWEDVYLQLNEWIDCPMEEPAAKPDANSSSSSSSSSSPSSSASSSSSSPSTGYMKSMFRIGLYAHWFLLAGGRTRFERLIGDPKGYFGKRVPTIDRSGDPLPSLFRRACAPALSPRDMTIPSGFFLPGILHYDTIAQHANKFRITRATTRPEVFENPTSEAIVPGFFSIAPELSRQPQLRFWNDLTNDWCEPMHVPLYDPREDGEWVLLPELELWPGGVVRRADVPPLPSGYGPEDEATPLDSADARPKSD